MNWPVYALTAYVLLAFQTGLADTLAFPSEYASGGIQPRFILIFAIFIGLSASATTAIVSCAILGFTVDLIATRANGTVIGPYTLGYIAATYLLIQLRPMLFRQHPLTFAPMTFLCGLLAHLIVTAVFTIRYWYDGPPDYAPVNDLITRTLSLLYTAAIALFFAWPMIKLTPLYGFRIAKTQGPWRKN